MFTALTSPKYHRWIMVSGAPQSGTTFVGTILSLPWNVNTIYEPFNPTSGLEWNAQRYLHVGDAATLDPVVRARLEDFFAYRFKLKTVMSDEDGFLEQAVKRAWGGGNQFTLMRARLNPAASVSLIKDPIAVFLAETFADLRDVRTIAMIRHPLSFVGSLKRLKWRFRLEPILSQPDLRRRWAPELANMTEEPDDWIVASSWVWKVVNRYILDVATRRAEIVALTQEHLSINPDHTFRSLFAHFDLDYTPRIAAQVHKFSATIGKGASRRNVVHDFRRESAAIFSASVALLDETEQTRVLDICWPVAREIYLHERSPDTRPDFLAACAPCGVTARVGL